MGETDGDFPVYDSEGAYLGDYAWKEIYQRFKDNWRLEGGVFYLIRPIEDTDDSLDDSLEASRSMLDQKRIEKDGGLIPSAGKNDGMDQDEPGGRTEVRDGHGDRLSDERDAARQFSTSFKKAETNDIVRVESPSRDLCGFFPLSQVRTINGTYMRRKDGTCVYVQSIKSGRRKALLERSLKVPGLSREMRDMIDDEIDTFGKLSRVLMRNGMLVGFYTKREAHKKWSVSRLVDGQIIIRESLSNEDRIALLRSQLEHDGRLNRSQSDEIYRMLFNEPRTPRIVARESQQMTDTSISKDSNKTSTHERPRHVSVYDAGGLYLGEVKRQGVEKRIGKWDRDFYEYDGRSLRINVKIYSVPKKPGSLWGVLDKAQERYLSANHQVTRREKKERKKLSDRASIVMKHLVERSDDCREYVVTLMLPMEEKAVQDIVESELRQHPELYQDIQSYEQIRLKTEALANSYERNQSEDTDDLLARAHLFVFDDDAWWEARDCQDLLEKLPYPVCLVEDVLFWSANNEIKSREISESADSVVAGRMLSFVVNRCTSSYKADKTTVYRKTVDTLPGVIDVSNITGGQRPTRIRGKISSAKQGRSPRVHSRRGHWRNQAYGPGMKLHKRIWISDTIVRPGGKTFRITDTTRVHMVSL